MLQLSASLPKLQASQIRTRTTDVQVFCMCSFSDINHAVSWVYAEGIPKHLKSPSCMKIQQSHLLCRVTNRWFTALSLNCVLPHGATKDFVLYTLVLCKSQFNIWAEYKCLFISAFLAVPSLLHRYIKLHGSYLKRMKSRLAIPLGLCTRVSEHSISAKELNISAHPLG